MLSFVPPNKRDRAIDSTSAPSNHCTIIPLNCSRTGAKISIGTIHAAVKPIGAACISRPGSFTGIGSPPMNDLIHALRSERFGS